MKFSFTSVVAAFFLAACSRTMCEIPGADGKGAMNGSTMSGSPNIQILDYGPRTAQAGAPFNRQPDGRSAMWFRLDANLQGSVVKVFMGDTELQSDVSGSMVTVSVPDQVHAKVGVVSIRIEAQDSKKRSKSNIVTLALE